MRGDVLQPRHRTHTVEHAHDADEMPVAPIGRKEEVSGTVGVACLQRGVPYVGIEVEPAYFDVASAGGSKGPKRRLQAGAKLLPFDLARRAI